MNFSALLLAAFVVASGFLFIGGASPILPDDVGGSPSLGVMDVGGSPSAPHP